MSQNQAAVERGLEIPVRDDFVESGGIARGAQLLKVLDEVGVHVAGRSVVDLGAGFGSLSMVAARTASKVTAVDIHAERLSAITVRAAGQGVDVETVQANLLDRRISVTGDVSIMVGVVEYAGLWSDSDDVAGLQVQVLESARSSLNDGGVFVMATKNRLWPKTVAREVHTGRPLIAALPRRAADAVAGALWNERYRHWIHTPGGWRKLLGRAGFSRIETYVPYLGYQYPVLLSSRPSRLDIARVRAASTVDGVDKAQVLGRGWEAKAGISIAAARVGLEMSQGIVFVARP